MSIRSDEISKIIRDQIGSFAVDVDVAEVGQDIGQRQDLRPQRLAAGERQ